ncbi:MAG: heavy metal-binding domain-containing protein [Phycisphaerae bacterium]
MRRILSAMLVMVLFGVFGSGCLQAKRREAVRYDAATDTFHVLRLYTDITAADAADVQHLAALYANRDHMLLYDPVAIFKEAAAVRLGKDEVLQVSLGEHEVRPDVTKTDLDFSQVTITPGQFFLSPNKTLCYYHQMSAPGTFIDQLLAKGSVALRTQLVAEIKKERARRHIGGQRESLDLAQQRLLDNLNPPRATEPIPPATVPATQADGFEYYCCMHPQVHGPLPGKCPICGMPLGKRAPADSPDSAVSYLSDASLDALDKGITDKTLTLVRHGGVISLQFALAPDDALALRANLTQLCTTLRVLADTNPPARNVDRNRLAAIANLLDALVITPRQDGSVTAAVNAADVVDLLMAAMDADEAAKSETSTTGPAAAPAASGPKQLTTAGLIAGLRAQGVPIDAKLALPDIVPAFKKGSLPANPSATPQAPGIHLFDAPPETAPAK